MPRRSTSGPWVTGQGEYDYILWCSAGAHYDAAPHTHIGYRVSESSAMSQPSQPVPSHKPSLSFWQIWNMCFGFLGIQFGFALQNANVSRIFCSAASG